MSPLAAFTGLAKQSYRAGEGIEEGGRRKRRRQKKKEKREKRKRRGKRRGIIGHVPKRDQTMQQ